MCKMQYHMSHMIWGGGGCFWISTLNSEPLPGCTKSDLVFRNPNWAYENGRGRGVLRKAAAVLRGVPPPPLRHKKRKLKIHEIGILPLVVDAPPLPASKKILDCSWKGTSFSTTKMIKLFFFHSSKDFFLNDIFPKDCVTFLLYTFQADK